MQGITPVLPTFRYHPDPISTGSVKPSQAACICCGASTGFIYVASVYGREKLRDSLCPWCIANGRAASEHDCFFSDGDPLADAGVPRPIIIEVTRRTPGYSSWQQEVWQSCCGDACEFHGDASKAELTALHGEALVRLQSEWPISLTRWAEFVKSYVPGGGMAVYRFLCRHCGQPKYALDIA